ncbi:hypothetical protein EI555_010346 [Monodon monoceros]|uniref:Uncharacterized protein n=1 Tax=Monodon monoceros TaxID=40151 RepID=A0A4U1FSE2_MONMO|nr:hypothetical protein EI555_010346 [Monodon monoceros]
MSSKGKKSGIQQKERKREKSRNRRYERIFTVSDLDTANKTAYLPLTLNSISKYYPINTLNGIPTVPQKKISFHGTQSKWPTTSLYDLKYDTCTQSIKATKQLPYHKVAQFLLPRGHERFRIASAFLDQLRCEFPLAEARGAGTRAAPGLHFSPQGSVPGDPVCVHCNITESYPAVPPIWSAESDDPNLAALLERLVDIKKGNTLLLQHLKRIISDLCKLCNLFQHPDVEMLDQPLPEEQCTQEDVSSEGEDEEMPEDTEDLDHYEINERRSAS